MDLDQIRNIPNLITVGIFTLGTFFDATFEQTYRSNILR